MIEFEKRKEKLQTELAHLAEVEKAAGNPDGDDDDDDDDEPLSIKEMMGLTRGKGKKKGNKAKQNGKGSLKSRMKNMSFEKGGSRSGGQMNLRDIGYLNSLWKKIQSRTGLTSADELATVFLQVRQSSGFWGLLLEIGDWTWRLEGE